MIRRLIQWWKARQLRKAREEHAYWKARHAQMEERLRADPGYRVNTANHERLVEAAGEVARYEERVETLYREQCTQRP